MKGHYKLILVQIIATFLIGAGVTLIDQIEAFGQSKARISPYQEGVRDPFLLPTGIHLLSKNDTVSGTRGIPSKKETEPGDIPSSPLKVNAILISDHIRLALIDHHILTVGDSIQDKKVLEIKTDRVILGRGDQRKTLLLSQSPLLLSVEKK